MLHVVGADRAVLGVPDTPENRAKVIAGIPLGRMSTAQDTSINAHGLSRLLKASGATLRLDIVEVAPGDAGRMALKAATGSTP